MAHGLTAKIISLDTAQIDGIEIIMRIVVRVVSNVVCM